MKIFPVILMIISGSIFFPSVNAISDVRQWEQHIITETSQGIVQTNFNVTTPHTLEKVSTKNVSWILWQGVYQTTGDTLSATQTTLQVEIDNADITGCRLIVRRDAGDTTTRQRNFDIRCKIPSYLNDGTHSLEVKLTTLANMIVTITTISQTLTLLQQDVVTEPIGEQIMSLETEIGTAIGALVWLMIMAMGIFFTTKLKPVQIAGTLGLIFGVFSLSWGLFVFPTSQVIIPIMGSLFQFSFTIYLWTTETKTGRN